MMIETRDIGNRREDVCMHENKCTNDRMDRMPACAAPPYHVTDGMNEWMNEWMFEWNECMPWMNEWMNEWMF